MDTRVEKKLAGLVKSENLVMTEAYTPLIGNDTSIPYSWRTRKLAGCTPASGLQRRAERELLWELLHIEQMCLYSQASSCCKLEATFDMA